MDFIEGLTKSQLKSVILVVVDRLAKYVHFIALSHPYTASKVASVYMQFVFKLPGMPASVLSDRDSHLYFSFLEGINEDSRGRLSYVISLPPSNRWPN